MCAGLRRAGLFIAALCLTAALSSAPAGAAPVSGLVFHDYNTNGLLDTDATRGAVDTGVRGLTVRAIRGTSTVVASTTTGPDGRYTLNAPDARVRLDLTVDPPWFPTRQLNGLRSDEQFVDASSPVAGADFGVHQLREWSIDNPLVFWPVQWPGPTGGPDAGRDAIRGVPYFTTPLTGGRYATQPVKVAPATFGQIGTTYGLGLDQRTGDLFAGAYYKRYAGLTGDGTGAIFRVTQGGAVSLFADLPAGADGHPGANTGDWFGTAPANRDMSWDLVGKRGLGSVEVDPDDRDLYAINLYDKKLYRLSLDGTPPVRPAAATPIPDPGCAGGEWRPFSIGFDRVRDDMYVGGVCAAEASQRRADLRAVVLRVSDPAGSPAFSPVLNVPLDYGRVPSPATAAPTQATTSDWRPWPTATTINGAGFLSPADVARGTLSTVGGRVKVNDESYPQLTGLAFDGDGSISLAFRDLMGDMSGQSVIGEGNTDPPDPSFFGASVTAQGDLLRAAPSGAGFVLESGGTVGGRTGFGAYGVYSGGYGPTGPGGGYFYNPLPGIGAGAAPSNQQGGALQVPGFRDLLTTQNDVLQATENGLLWYDTANGAKTRRFENLVSSPTSATGGFQKANGLGDLDAYVARAPVQIGNRLWYDEDNDGIMDPDEPPVVGVVVELLDAAGIVIDNTRTDDQGEYVFQIAPDTSYTVRVPLDQPALDGWFVTRTETGDDRRTDSNGIERDGYSVAAVGPHAPGHNDHSYDFGFSRTAVPPEPPPPTTPTTTTETPEPPPPPAPPAAQPPPPQQPEYAGASDGTIRRSPLVLVKYLAKGAGQRRLQFGMVVRNTSAEPVSGVQVCDRLPALLDYIGATKLARKLSGRRVCWRIATLTSGQARKYRIDTQLRGRVLLAVLINHATATGVRIPPARARVTLRPKPRPPKVTG